MAHIKVEAKICKRCGKLKPLTEFYKHKGFKDGLSCYCKECYSKKHREYYNKNRKKFRDYYRKHIIGENGGKKQISGLNKRDWTGYCELCGKSNVRLDYHHWDNKNPSKGIWVCFKCHMMVTAYEHGKLAYLQRYLRLKRFLNKQYKLEEKLKVKNN